MQSLLRSNITLIPEYLSVGSRSQKTRSKAASSARLRLPLRSIYLFTPNFLRSQSIVLPLPSQVFHSHTTDLLIISGRKTLFVQVAFQFLRSFCTKLHSTSTICKVVSVHFPPEVTFLRFAHCWNAALCSETAKPQAVITRIGYPMTSQTVGTLIVWPSTSTCRQTQNLLTIATDIGTAIANSERWPGDVSEQDEQCLLSPPSFRNQSHGTTEKLAKLQSDDGISALSVFDLSILTDFN